jgi:hypothetical protein
MIDVAHEADPRGGRAGVGAADEAPMLVAAMVSAVRSASRTAEWYTARAIKRFELPVGDKRSRFRAVRREEQAVSTP